MKFSPALSQIFIKDKRYIRKILSYLDEEEEILEIGAGRGELTQHLVKKAKFLYCVEIDFRLFNLLKKKFSCFSNIEIIHADILKFPLSSLEKQLVIVGNIPYHISNRLIRYLIDNRKYIKKAFLTFQKEFAQKLDAKVSTSGYSFLSCYIQYYAKVERLFTIPAKAFYPPPKVDSAFCRLEFYRKPIYKVEDESFLFQLIREAFRSRRKKIINSLPLLKKRPDTLSKINPNLRAENLSLKEYIWLVNLFKKNDVSDNK
jgi:16S rRNA (adenine1518-N6/adenine1519-N6)-dimethyltransferase